MAPVNCTGFETGDNTLESHSTSGTFSVQSSTKRTGAYALRVNPTTTGTGYWSLGALTADGQHNGSFNLADIWVRFYFRYATKPSSNNEEVCVIRHTGSNDKLILRLESTGVLSLYARGANFLGTGTTVLDANRWYCIELRAGTGASGAAYELKINNVVELTGTTNLTTSNSQHVRFGKPTDRNGNSIDVFYDDVLVDNAAYPGPGAGKILVPTADGPTTDWTQGTNSSNWEEVNDIPHDSDTTYIKSNGSVTQVHYMTLQSSSAGGIIGPPNFVKAFAILREDTSGTSSSVVRILSGSAEADTDPFDHTTTYALISKGAATDPNTAAAWTKSGLDAINVGVIESNAIAMRCTAMGAYVDYKLKISSIADGNWSSTSTWTSGYVPGDGNMAVIESTHDVTVDASTTVGHSPQSGAADQAILVNGTGTLTLGSGNTLTCRGDIYLNNATFTMNSGSTFRFDATQAFSPSTAAYEARVSTANSQATSKITISGTSGSRSTFTSLTTGGAAKGKISAGPIGSEYTRGGKMDANFCDFSNLGSSTVAAFTFSLSTSDDEWSMDGCVVDGCGIFNTTANIVDGTTFFLNNTTFKNELNSTYDGTINSPNALTTGSRYIKGCVFNKALQLFPPRDITIGGSGAGEWNVLYGGGYETTDAAWASFSYNLVRDNVGSSPVNIAASISNCYFVIDGSVTNPHFLQGITYSRNMTVDTVYFEFTGTDNTGDCIIVGSPSSAATLTIIRCIVVPNANNESSGTLVSALGNANATFSVERCTYHTGSQGAAVCETYAGHANMCSYFRNNIAWDTTASRGYKLYDSGTDNETNDVVTSGNCNYNCGHNLLAGNNLKGYNNLEFSSGSPGANDVDVDPQFADKNWRKMKTFDARWGGPGTVANFFTELMKKNESGYNSRYNLPDFLTYIREGYTPTNPLLIGAGSDGGDIGAVSIGRHKTLPLKVRPPANPPLAAF